MKVVDLEVYVVGYRKTDNDDWLVFNNTFNSKIDTSLFINKQKGLNPDIQFKVFKYGRAMPMEM